MFQYLLNEPTQLADTVSLDTVSVTSFGDEDSDEESDTVSVASMTTILTEKEER